jgi:hypothetical protein
MNSTTVAVLLSTLLAAGSLALNLARLRGGIPAALEEPAPEPRGDQELPPPILPWAPASASATPQRFCFVLEPEPSEVNRE